MFLNPAICALLGWALLHERFGWKTAAGWGGKGLDGLVPGRETLHGFDIRY